MKKRGERGDRNHVVISERGETGVGRWGGGSEGEKKPLFTCSGASGSFEERFPESRSCFISVLLYFDHIH